MINKTRKKKEKNQYTYTCMYYKDIDIRYWNIHKNSN